MYVSTRCGGKIYRNMNITINIIYANNTGV